MLYHIHLFVAVAVTVLGIASEAGMSQTQAPNCFFLGPVYPAPTDVLSKSAAVPQAINTLKINLNAALKNGTLGAANTSFHISVFSTEEVILDFSYAAPGANGSLTTGVLDRDTVFRIGSVSKLLTVYALLAAVGLSHMNDPVTKWIPELDSANSRSSVNGVRWSDVTIGALAGQMAGLSRDRRSIGLRTTKV